MGFVDNSHVRVISGRLSMENGHTNIAGSNGNLPKFKRRRVSAFRDFPVGFGPSRIVAPVLNVPASEAAAAGLSGNSGVETLKSVGNDVDVRKDDCNGGVGIPVAGLSGNAGVETLKSVENDIVDVRKDDCNGGVVISVAGLSGNMGVEALKSVGNEIVDVRKDDCNGGVGIPVAGLSGNVGVETLKSTGNETVDVRKYGSNGRVVIPVAGSSGNAGVETLKSMGNENVDVRKDDCNDGVVISVENAVVKKFSPKYPPRRKVSAVRDFPAFCGRNAPRIEVSAEVVGKRNVVEVKLQVEESVQKGDPEKHGLEMNTVQVESAGSTSNEMRNQDDFGVTDKNQLIVIDQDFKEQSIKSQKESIQCHRDLKDDAVLELSKMLIEGLEESDSLGIAFDRIVVLGLKASGNRHQQQVSKAHKTINLASGSNESNWKKSVTIQQEQPRASTEMKKDDVENSAETYVKNKKTVLKKSMIKKKSLVPVRKAHRIVDFAEWDKEENFETEADDLHLVKRSCEVEVTLPPSIPSSSSSNDASVTRQKVRETLRLFQVIFRRLVKGDESKQKPIRRPDCAAGTILKDNGRYINTSKIIGPVPGVEVGDEFQYRVELNIIGLHRQSQGGIDYVNVGGRVIATSIVASGGYDDDMDDSDFLIYTGSGGMSKKDKEAEDQKLERGNLALKNSIDEKNLVRVIRGEERASESSGAKTRAYVYDGLYLVEKYWQEMGAHGKLIFKFKLVRVPGQPELAWKVVKKSKKFKVREGLCVDDISEGKEIIPICAVNTIDDEKPPPFTYVTHVIYPDWCQPIPPKGCDCTNGCSETSKCSCVRKNGGEIPYNYSGAIVQAKPLVYECGPSCKCPPSCYNRVTQNGIKFQLEIFKTESRGWGVRSLNSISSGSFICEYAGELLEEAEAEQRAGSDEYLFDIGHNSSDLWNGLSSIMSEIPSSSCEVIEESSFTIDAANYGSVGRFINHSCSPNLYAQNVLCDHEDKRIPHIMFFAAENIPPLQELTYDYNYIIDQVVDSHGNIKKKDCYCGSSECKGRMY